MPRVLKWYPWYPADYRADTRHLTRTQRDAYRETLDEIFLRGQDSDPPSIPDDDESLSDLWSTENELEYRAFRAVLIEGRRAVLVSIDGRISQKRMSVEIAKGLDKSEKRAAAASKRWAGRTETALESTNDPKEVVPHAGNGNGHATMSDKQFLFYAGRVGKWLDENRDMYAGGDGKSFNAAFKRAIGITWSAWSREREKHQLEQ